jgi:hypothetical protein
MRGSGATILATKITSDALESYLNCKTMAHLKIGGPSGDHVG